MGEWPANLFRNNFPKSKLRKTDFNHGDNVLKVMTKQKFIREINNKYHNGTKQQQKFVKSKVLRCTILVMPMSFIWHLRSNSRE